MAKRHYTSAFSIAFGKFASKEFSPFLQYIINRSYITLMGLDMGEFKKACEYSSLNQLFTRALVSERPMPEDENLIVSPADALVSDYGTIVEGKAYQIKGMEYPLDELLGDEYRRFVGGLEGGNYINLYLSPRDYHRYHIPMDMTIKSLTHIPGKLYPVNFPLLRNKKNLFIENERVVIACEDNEGRLFFMVLVGALNVGKMVVSFEPRVNTNSDITTPQHYSYEGLQLQKGELFGWFEMGSTILLFTPQKMLLPQLAINEKVKFAQPIAKKLSKD
jgi:phosphatidylserine decarboxylase